MHSKTATATLALLLALVSSSLCAPAPSSTSPLPCPSVDNEGSALLSTSTDEKGFLNCKFENAGLCVYFGQSGSFSQGSSVCPVSASPDVPDSGATCPDFDKKGSALATQTDAADPPGGVTCRYPIARVCVYFSDGSFSSGSSDCPEAIPAGEKTPAAPPSPSPSPFSSPSAAASTEGMYGHVRRSFRA